MTENESLKIMLAYKLGRGCKPHYSDEEIEKAFDTAISALQEIQQYRAIGTVEECREAVEKRKPKKPRDIEYDYSYFICPTCGEGIYVSDNFESHKFCLNCGQAIRCPDENLEGMEDE